ncbi:MAG: metallophosphoesterase [Candidatus Neomarinimicrobiota bacterium]
MAFDRRYIIIGDVHGNLEGMDLLLEKAGYKPTEDRLVFVGDYNDHLSYSDFSVMRLIDRLIGLYERSPDNIFFIRGNHDLWFAEWLLNGGVPPEIWYVQGGRETLASYGIVSVQGTQDEREKVPRSHQDFICNHVDQYYLDERVLVIHGGFTSERQMQVIAAGGELSDEDLEMIVWDRYFIFTANDSVHSLYRQYFADRYLVTGHTPEGPFVNPRNTKWMLINCASRGENLCAVIIEDDQSYTFIRT